MLKNIAHIFLLFILISVAGQSEGSVDPIVEEVEQMESDSLITENDAKTLDAADVVANSTDADGVKFWEKDEEVEEESDSALSFNFIYYIIEKFKFQGE